MTTTNPAHRVVIIGGGFGGLHVALALKGSGAQITLIDRRNHHLFQPLLYQVATASLGTADIAWPIRHLLKNRPDVTTLLATVTGIDKEAREVVLSDDSRVPYDTLVLATGARHAYFGRDEWEQFAPGLKTLEDATSIRRKLLLAFERAEREPDPLKRAALLTFVVIGAGPTGVELAGAIVELARVTMRHEFRHIQPEAARVVLVEAGPRVLPAFAEDLSAYTQRTLERLGVEVVLGQPVTDINADGIVYGGKDLKTRTVLWAAGVLASPAASWLGAEADRAGRVIVEKDLTVPGHPEIYALGDTALMRDPEGKPIPGVGHAAKQQGRHVGRTIKARLRGDTAPRPLIYRHAGDLATIGKRAAVIDFGWLKLKGLIGWWTWDLAHIYFLIGVKNRLFVALSWLWTFLTGNRSARLITQGDADPNLGKKPR